MKKRDSIKKEGNIVFFPNLQKKILEKGLKFLEENRFNEAIQLFEEAIHLDQGENHEIYMGLVLAYSGAGELQKAKQLAQVMLKKGIGEYFVIIDLYLTILLQLHEYEEIIHIIECLFEEREIPAKRYEHFSNLLNFSKKMLDTNEVKYENHKENNEDLDVEKNFLFEKDINKVILQVTKMANQNIRPYVKIIGEYLMDEKGHPFIKTILLNILKEQEYGEDILVEKFTRKQVVNPLLLKNIDEMEQIREIEENLKEHLENHEPVLLQLLIPLVERHFFLMYPFEFVPDIPALWAAAYHYIGKEYNGEENKKDEICQQHHINEKELEQACEFIKKLEEISYPNI